MSIYESGWIINFKNGYRIILSEKAYTQYSEKTPKEDVESEEHWFILKDAIKKNPELDYVE